MNPFIKKHEYNYIKKCLYDLNNALKNCIDIGTVDTTRLYIQDKIYSFFTNLSEEERELLDISNITDSFHINAFLSKLNGYVYGIPKITNQQISKLFKKEKKLKLPDLSIQDSPKVYLGWIDQSIRKLLIVYNLDGKFISMACRLTNSNSNNTNVCTFCNHIGTNNEVAFVSPVCKTSHLGPDAYRSLGFHVCLDSEACNERITSTEKLEDILRNVNHIKK